MDSVYVLSDDTIIEVDKKEVVVPAFADELKVSAYFKCGEYNGKGVYNVPCTGATCEALRKSKWFLGNNELELAFEQVEVAKTLCDVTVEIDDVDEELKPIKVLTRMKYKTWETAGKLGVMKRIDKPVMWQ